jgi:ketosteroid isomerase-like protein
MTKDDTEAIRRLIGRQFASMCWTPNNSADWKSFAADFAPWATLYPAARPARPHTVERFVKRMNGLAETTLHSFFETPLGAAVHVFGNVAVAAAGCEVTENGTKVNRGVEMMLLMKDECGWRIVAQAWDTEKSAGLHIPHELAERHHDKRADAPVPLVPRHDSHA